MRLAVPLLPRRLRWIGVGVVAFAIVYFSVITVPETPAEAGPLWDKQLHFAAYGVLSLALAYATTEYRRRVWVRAGVVIVAVVVFGGLVELLQGFVPHRYPSALDFLSNVLGVILASAWFLIERHLEYSRVW